ncbi:alpha/beta fold hydrolase [Rhodobacteraceae bacterium 2CG4]|uniref:Alpha/beta fold hydrolase n=1 Tax=Halovulum marinum TaxID=2662447 RepID=A0A6L5Z3V6_9RHOB|nr:alpha/beta hydrolase [Halovulum marinum]MSU90989.1 alpha/beta fold hydrolase [Halovulum marinum]
MRPDRRRALGAAAALGAGLLAACTGGRGAAPDAAAARGEFVEVEGLRLHYRTMGRGPKAVVIHGASGNMRDWTIGPAETLARSNTLLLFDRPGLGFSERPARGGSDPFVQARLMRAAAAKLGFGRAHLVGHSYGGSVALAWALDAPDSVSGLLAIAAPSQVWDGGVGLVYELAANPVTGPLFAGLAPGLVGEDAVKGAIARVFAPQSPPPGYAEQIGARLALRPETLRANARDLTRLKGHIRRMVPRYGTLRMPVELVHGDADEVVGAAIHSDLLARQLPDVRYDRLAGIGHMPHHVATGAVAAALARLNARL